MPHVVATADQVDDLWKWRYAELVRAGYPANVAAMLAARRLVDLHEACDLLKHGCPVDKALGILL